MLIESKQDITEPHYNRDIIPSNIVFNPLPPVKVLKSMTSEDFEELVHEWAWGCLKSRYEKICNLGGPGDKGRDIAAYKNYKENKWDNYQCKHYNKKLATAEAIKEIGKLCYHCYSKRLTPPDNYYFVTCLGVGSDLHDLLKKPDELKNELLKRWDKTCKDGICEESVVLDSNLKKFIQEFNFKIFDYIEPLELISQFKTTPYYYTRFGGFSKSRPLNKEVPQEFQNIERVYIRKILDAYGEHLEKDIEDAKRLDEYPEIKKDLEEQRKYFFAAESLSAFSRDIIDPDIKSFEDLQQEIYEGIKETIREDAKDGFERLNKVLKRASELVPTTPLYPYLKIPDKKGICHVLANEREDVKWKK